jgi:hypothetical protein
MITRLPFNTIRRAVTILLCTALLAASLVYASRVREINHRYEELYARAGDVALRKFPYPYKAAFTIANDIDETETLEEFLDIQKFLNTTGATSMGPGVGLELATSCFMFPGETMNRFAYFSERPCDRTVITRFIRAGYIDALHSWGSGFKDRRSAELAVAELRRQQLKLFVWSNHANNRSNFGNWRAGYGPGDDPGSVYYHADITIPYGVKYVWLGSSTWMVGQATPIAPIAFLGSYDRAFPFDSFVNLSEALAKHVLSVFGLWRSRYALHASNDLVQPVTLDDGRRVYQFHRYENHFGGIGRGAFAHTMHYDLSPRVITRLVDAAGYGILYAHFGENAGCPQPICSETRDALRYLSEKYRNGEVYVTTTAKLLTYYTTHKYLTWHVEKRGHDTVIIIDRVDDPVFGAFVPEAGDLQGMTFYVPSARNARVFVGDREVRPIQANPADQTGRESVSVPKTYLTFPDLSGCDR